MRVQRLTWDGIDARAQAAALREDAIGPDEGALERAREIVARVRAGGDAVLAELTAHLDATDMSPDELQLRVDPTEIERARSELDSGVVGALEIARRNVETVARAELQAAAEPQVELAQGQVVGIVERAVSAAGVYVPGGRGAYPSSVLMCCVPARVAGVGRIAVASPPGPDGRVAAGVLAACSICGVEEVFAIGGAQAVAALAYGTETVRPVDVVVGPGNRYVNAAKRLVCGDVGLDGIAGPSELVAVVDSTANPRWIALDLLAQAEHGDDGLLAAISDDQAVISSIVTELESLAAERPSVRDATFSCIVAPDLAQALDLADAIAPEHLELALEHADERLAGDRVAGCVFYGATGAVAFGDYVAGSNHVLPTGGAARFGAPLGVRAFQRRTSVIDVTAEGAGGLAPRVATLSRAEGFPVHGESAEARVGD
jgi:histidinol dehydrogenase